MFEAYEKGEWGGDVVGKRIFTSLFLAFRFVNFIFYSMFYKN